MACWWRKCRLWGWTQLFLKVCAFHFFSWSRSELSVRLVLVRVTVLIPSSSLILVSRGELRDLEWWLIIFGLVVWVMTSLMCFGREGVQQGVNVTFGFWQHSTVYESSCVPLKHCSLQLFHSYLSALLLWLANLPLHIRVYTTRTMCHAMPVFFFALCCCRFFFLNSSVLAFRNGCTIANANAGIEITTKVFVLRLKPQQRSQFCDQLRK